VRTDAAVQVESSGCSHAALLRNYCYAWRLALSVSDVRLNNGRTDDCEILFSESSKVAVCVDGKTVGWRTSLAEATSCARGSSRYEER
jgi:hypothetical protein